MNKIYFIALSLFLVGCTTAFDTRRQELQAAYQQGKIPADIYFKLKNDIDREETVYSQNMRESWQRAADEVNRQNAERDRQNQELQMQAMQYYQNRNQEFRMRTDCHSDSFGTHCQ